MGVPISRSKWPVTTSSQKHFVQKVEHFSTPSLHCPSRMHSSWRYRHADTWYRRKTNFIARICSRHRHVGLRRYSNLQLRTETSMRYMLATNRDSIVTLHLQCNCRVLYTRVCCASRFVHFQWTSRISRHLPYTVSEYSKPAHERSKVHPRPCECPLYIRLSS